MEEKSEEGEETKMDNHNEVSENRKEVYRFAGASSACATTGDQRLICVPWVWKAWLQARPGFLCRSFSYICQHGRAIWSGMGHAEEADV